jgi:hypothetical protein
MLVFRLPLADVLAAASCMSALVFRRLGGTVVAAVTVALVFGFGSPANAQYGGGRTGGQMGSGVVGQSGVTRTPRLTLDDANVKLGIVGLQFGAGLTFEYNDNVNLADAGVSGELGVEEDLFITPRVLVDATIPITQINILTIGIDAGYEFSVNGTRESGSQIGIAPGSQIGFLLNLGDVTVQFYDTFSVENNPVGQTGVGSTSQYSLFTNTAGVTAEWDINDLDLAAGYNYTINRVFGSADGREDDRDTHGFFTRATLSFLGVWSAGLEGSVLYSTSSGDEEGEQSSQSIGPFVAVQLTPHTSLSGSVGIQRFEGDAAGSQFNGSVSDSLRFGSFPATESTGDQESSAETMLYWSFRVQNNLNRYYRHGLTAGQERQVGVGVDFADVTYVRYTADWLLFPKVALQLSSGFDFIEQTFDGFTEKATVLTCGLGFSYFLTPHLSANVNYQFASRSSDQEFRDYRQNIFRVGFFYDF